MVFVFQVTATKVAAFKKVVLGLYHGVKVMQLGISSFALYCILEAFDLFTNQTYLSGPILMQGYLLVGQASSLWSFEVSYWV